MKLLFFLLLWVFAFPVAAQTDEVPRFEEGECPFQPMMGQTVECGFVVVQEVHGDPDSGEIRIAVARFIGQDGDADPLMLLSGGPGEKTTANAGFVAVSFSAISPERDLILFDQRGVGRSEPALECPEWEEAQLALLQEVPDSDRMMEVNYTELLACGERLIDEGYNLSAFNSLENAADVRDIAQVFGYDQVNLIGVSYGSLLAQHVIREYPELVRSAVIDSVLPLEGSFFYDTLDSAVVAINRLLDACAADEACNSAYPNLREVLFETIDRLNTEPVEITITHPLTGEQYDSYLGGDTVLSLLTIYLYQTPTLPQLPSVIDDVYNENYEAIAQLANFLPVAYQSLSRGMQYSVQCAEDVIGVTTEQYLERTMAIPPQLRGQGDIEVLAEHSPLALCENWPVETLDPSVKTPLVSDVPVLLFGGEFDPVTPFVYAEQVAATLSNSYAYEVPAVGHSVLLASECTRTIATQFINDPSAEPDAACIEALPEIEFFVPGIEIDLVPFESETFGISGLIPEGWNELAPGTFAESATSTVVILQQALPGGADAVTGLLTQQLGLDEFPEPTETIELPGLVWNLYEVTVQGQPADLAVTEADGTGYLVLLISTPNQREVYYNQVFLPAVNAFMIGE